MDDIIKSIAVASPYAAVIIFLGNQALNVLKEYIKCVVARNDLIKDRLTVIEQRLQITPPVQPPAPNVEGNQTG